MHPNLPIVGAAMPIKQLAEHRDWLIADQRDLEIQDAFMPEVLDSDWSGLVRQARDLLDGYTGRLGIHGPFVGFSLSAGFDPKLGALIAERLRRALAFGAELGATHMVIHSPFIFFGANTFLPHSPAFRQADEIALVHATLESVLPVAEQAKCTLVIENIQDTNAAPLRTLVQSFESEYVRMSLDTGHAFITHRASGPPPDQWVREAGPLLAHIHLQDTDGNVDRHWAPGNGSINWYALFEALGELQHQPRLILELRKHAEIPQGAAWFAQRGLAR